MPHRLLTQALALLFFASLPVASHAEGIDWFTDFEMAKSAAQKYHKPLLVHFSAEWCGPCRKMESGVLTQKEVLTAIREGIVAVKVNVDKRQDLAKRFGIESLPSDIVLEPTGERMLESTGYRPVNEYAAMIRRAQVRFAELTKSSAEKIASKKRGPAQEQTRLASNKNNPPMIDGYCPVTLWENRKWVKGSPTFQATHRGQVYYLSSAKQREKFLANPGRYTPRFLGCDPVIVWESDKAVPGTTRYGAFYDDELYLFTSIENRNEFKRNPDRYIRTRIVLRPEHLESVVR